MLVLKNGVSQSMPLICSWCEAKTSQKGSLCSSCFRPIVPWKAEDRTTEGEIRKSVSSALGGKVQIEMQLVSKKTVTDKIEKSKRAKDHWQNARKLVYSDVVTRYINVVWHRETMIECGCNLCHMCRWEHDGDPKMREGTIVKMPKAIREERGLGQ